MPLAGLCSLEPHQGSMADKQKLSSERVTLPSLAGFPEELALSLKMRALRMGRGRGRGKERRIIPNGRHSKGENQNQITNSVCWDNL